MHESRLTAIWKKLNWIKPWYFLVLALACGIVCVFSLRANNQHMIVLRDAVYKADKDGADTKQPLKNLQAYVTTHMNTDLSAGDNSVYPPIQLKYTYNRLVDAQNQQQDKNTKLYSEAQAHCEALNHVDFSGHNRVPCIEQYVQSHGGSQNAADIPEDLYKFAFASPTWSPDLAGWTLIATILSAILFVIKMTADRVARRRDA
jgi:hypothetical protein